MSKLAIVRRGVVFVGDVDDDVHCVSRVCHVQHTRRVGPNGLVRLSEEEFQRLEKSGTIEAV
jgi:hypothetical protein